MNIYLGHVNIASILTDLKRAFERLGHRALVVHNEDQSPTQDVCDRYPAKETAGKFGKFVCHNPGASREEQEREYRRISDEVQQFLFHEALDADICIFAWSSFSPDLEDIRLLRQRGIKVVVVLCGSEVRYTPVENMYRRLAGLPEIELPDYFEPSYLRQSLLHLRRAESLADMLCGGSSASLRPWYLPITTALDIGQISFAVPDNAVPQIVHAPSRRATKGTDIWLDIFADLKREGHVFDVHLIEGLPRKEYLALLPRMDIYCGSLLFGGKADREALAAGCACLGTIELCEYPLELERHSDALWRRFFAVRQGSEEDARLEEQNLKKTWWSRPECNPFIPVTPATARDRLRSVLQNRESLRELRHRGRRAMECYGSMDMVAGDILEYLREPDALHSQSMLSHPFFYHHYVPEGAFERAHVSLLNETTAIVRDAPWYKRFISPMQRDGLVF